MQKIRALATALVGMIALSGQSPGAINNRCDDFTSDPRAQIRGCSDLLDFNFGISIWHGLMMRAAAYFRAGDVENAKKDYASAIQSILGGNGFYSLADWYGSVCWTFAVLNLELEKSVGDCNKAFTLDPRNGFAFNSRGLIYLRTGKYREAIEDYDRALQGKLYEEVGRTGLYDSRRHYALFGRGLAKLRLGDIEGGRADIKAAEELKHGVTIEFAAYGLKLDPQP